jgi:hypothetical protein
MRFDARIRAAITPDREGYLPGETIMLDVELQAEEDVPVRDGRVQLIGRQRYRYQVREGDRHDDRQETETKTETDELVLTDSIFGPETLPAGQPVERWARFVIPRDAAPSGAGAIVEVTWLARLTIDVPRRRDAVAEIPLRVLVPREAYAERAETEPLHQADEARLTLVLPSRHAAAGQPLPGELRVEAEQDFTARSIRIELFRREEVTRELGQTASKVEVEQEIAGETEFLSDQRYAFPFSLAVPADVPPGSETLYTSVRWLLRAVLDRAERDDSWVEVELNLFNAPPA